MDTLRLSLLIIGLLVVALVYFTGKYLARRRREREADAELFEPDFEADEEWTVRPLRREAEDADSVASDIEALSGLVAERPGPQTVESAPAQPRSRPAPPAAHGEELILSFAVMAPHGRRFQGPDILEAVETAGLRHGAMGIFHLHGRDGDQPLCSLANVLEPGTFDPAAMDDFATPGLVLFMRLPGPMEGRIAFERTLEVGRILAERLGGELCDERRSVLTPQTVSHLKERVEAFRFRMQMMRVRQSRV